MNHFTKDNLPSGEFKEYRKKVLTKAIRIEGPFRTRTLEGPLECPDGYLAIDNAGNPYPIDRDIFEKTYEAT